MGLGERWLPVVGYTDIYDVSDLGRVWSWWTYRMLAASPYNRGYPRVGLTGTDGSYRKVTVHSIVAAAFLGPRPPGLDVRHKNGDRLDCRAVNLEYGTRRQNWEDAVRHGTYVPPSHDHQRAKVRCPFRHMLAAPNLRAARIKIGKRECLACHRASAAVSNARVRGGPVVIKTEAADQCYRAIMSPVLDPEWFGEVALHATG